MRLLLEKGADLSAKFTMTSRTALVIATEHGYTTIIDLFAARVVGVVGTSDQG